MTCNVTGTAISPNGQIKPGARITFSRAQLDVVSQGGAFVIPDDYIIQTAIDGTVNFNILPGVYDATTVAVSGRTVVFRVSVPDEPAADFADLLNASYVEIPPASVTQAQQARDAAIAARDAAELSADAAALYDGPWIDTVIALLSDATLTYTVGQPATVSAGDYVRTRAEGFSYEVAAPLATDHHITTAGGVKLYVRSPDVRAFGAVGDGVTDDTAAVLAASATGMKSAGIGMFLITNASIIEDIENWTGNGVFRYAGADLPIGPVTSFLRLDVPSVFSTIQNAVDFCEAKTFLGQGFIQIRIADGEYGTVLSPLPQIEPQFPNGHDRVEIIGNTSNKAMVKLFMETASNSCGFLFQRGNGIFKIDGMTIIGVGGRTAYGVWNNQTYGAGIMVNYNSQALIGSQVEVSDFYYGIASRYGSGVRCEPGVVVRNAGDCGFFAYGGSMDCQGCEAYDVAHISDGLGFGFTAEAGGFMDCSNSNTSGNYRAGFYANGAGMWAKETTSDNNQGDGYLAINGGKIECNPPPGGAATNSFLNGGCGYNVSTNSYINANSCLCYGNGSDGYRAQNNSVIDITVASSSHNAGNGFLAVDGSGMVGNGAGAFQNTGDGFRADTLSWFRGSSYYANLNGGWGYFAQNLSYMNIPGSGGVWNVAGFDSPPIAGTPANNGAYIEN